MSGVYTLPADPNSMPASQTGQAWEHRRGRVRKGAVDVMPAGGGSGVAKVSTDRTFEISANRMRQTVSAETRSIVRPLHRRAQKSKIVEQRDSGEAPTPAEDHITFTSGFRNHEQPEGGEEEWEYVEDTRPEETLDPNGDPVDSEDDEADDGSTGKRKVYASSVCQHNIFRLDFFLIFYRMTQWRSSYP